MKRRNFIELNFKAVGALGALGLAASGCLSTPEKQGPDTTMVDIDRLNERRSMAEYYVRSLSEKYATSPSVLTAWKEDYIVASSAVNQWISTIQLAIREGKDPISESSFNYQNRYESAVAKSEAFLESSRQLANAGPAKSPEMIALAFSLGSMLWNKYKNYQQAERERKARELDQYKWNSIESILKQAS